MIDVVFPTDELFAFAAMFLQHPFSFVAHTDPTSRTAHIDDTVTGQLLQRLAGGEPTILPYRTRDADAWLIVATSRPLLDHTLQKLSHWIIPSYAAPTSASLFPQLKQFDSAENVLQQLGAHLFPAGYYSLQSPKSTYDQIINRLGLWLALESQRPTLHIEREPSYHDLLRSFEAAMAATQWEVADQVLHNIRRRGLLSAENLLFLEIQLRNQRRDWSGIWNHPEFTSVASLKVPRAVRVAMLTAVHHVQLLELENQGEWMLAVERLAELKPRLGQLLTGRFGITHPAVIKIFAYLAVLDGDRAALLALQDEGGPNVSECLTALLAYVPVLTQGAPTQTVHDRYSQALREHNYDAALAAIETMQEHDVQVQYCIEIAYLSGDDPTAQRALLAWWELPVAAQRTLAANIAPLQSWLNHLEQRVDQMTAPSLSISTWSDWFTLLKQDSASQRLDRALESLIATLASDTISPAEVQQLSEGLLQILTTDGAATHGPGKDVIKRVTATVLNDNQFPREQRYYQDIYESLSVALQQQEVNETTVLQQLRLVDALLQHAPSRWHDFLTQLTSWLHMPIPALEDSVFEVFDLLADYGAQGSSLAQWYREWLSSMLSLPTPRPVQSLHLWRAFGQWIQPGADLLAQLDLALAATQEQDAASPISSLPAGYRIGIFTLRRSSADRARHLMLEQNEALDVRICTEQDLSPQVRSLAQNSDIVVVVTACITHALTYGIAPYVKDGTVIYANAGGSSSIMRALDQHLHNPS